jgi:hypothetical protein
MTISELSIQLQKLQVRKDAYSLDGGLHSEAYCLNHQAGCWEIYYSERGQKSGLQVFNSENDACQEFLNLIVHDKSIFNSE